MHILLSVVYHHSAACSRLPGAELQGHVARERGDHGGVSGRLLACLHLPAAAEASHLDTEGYLAAAQARRLVQRLLCDSMVGDFLSCVHIHEVIVREFGRCTDAVVFCDECPWIF